MLPKDGVNSTELSNKLTDTINLEIIEPLARVYRAYRFAKRVPECDKYVMCLINQEDQNEVQSLPGLKKALTKAGSVYVSWFLSGKTGTSFWTLYSNAMDEKDCSVSIINYNLFTKRIYRSWITLWIKIFFSRYDLLINAMTST